MLQDCESIVGLHTVQLLLNENLLIPSCCQRALAEGVSIATDVMVGHQSLPQRAFTQINGDTPCLC